MPASLRGFVQYHHAKPIYRQVCGETICAFETLPVSSATFVYVDGGIIHERDQGGDVLLLEENAPDDFAVLVDGRKNTVSLLKRALRGHYNVGPGPFGVQTLIVRRKANTERSSAIAFATLLGKHRTGGVRLPQRSATSTKWVAANMAWVEWPARYHDGSKIQDARLAKSPPLDDGRHGLTLLVRRDKRSLC